MAKFKDKHGHSRWQEGKKDVKAFLDKHGDEIGPFLKGVAKVAVPRASAVIEAIEEVRATRAPKQMQDKAIAALSSVLDDLEDDPQPQEELITYAEANNSGDIAKMINSTWASKYISPVVLILVTILFFGMWATEIGFYWNLCPNRVADTDKLTISTVFGTMIGLRQVIRGELKKKTLQT